MDYLFDLASQPIHVLLIYFRCYHEATGNIVYIAKYSESIPAQCLRYYSGRLFCAGYNGLTALDFSRSVVEECLVSIIG